MGSLYFQWSNPKINDAMCPTEYPGPLRTDAVPTQRAGRVSTRYLKTACQVFIEDSNRAYEVHKLQIGVETPQRKGMDKMQISQRILHQPEEDLGIGTGM